MRAGTFAALGITALVVAACVHEDRRVLAGPVVAEANAPAAPPPRSQYIAADPSGAKSAVTLALGNGRRGIAVDRRRVVVGRGEPLLAADNTPEPIAGASRIPSRFGGGFLFWTESTLYRSDAFESTLTPVARVPDPIEAVSFGPKTLLVRTRNGERWGLRPSGERAPVFPLGIADIQALDDGRAIAFSDQGAVFTSTDGGEHWVDATIQAKSPPAKLAVVNEELYLVGANGGASRLETDGHLSWFDKPPLEPDLDVRPPDPRWRGTEPPLRAALRFGASVDDRTALVVDAGNLVRVDVRTGDVVSVVVGRLPPDATCEAVPVTGDVLFACHTRSASGSFVVARTLESEGPIVEQSFAGGGVFFTSDDGGIVYAGTCIGTPATTSASNACVRMPSGRWEDRDLAFAMDGGGGAPGDIVVARWVPRADGHVVALVVEPSAGIYDPEAQSHQPLSDEIRDVIGHGGALFGISKLGKVHYRKSASASASVIDGSWSFAGGALRGWPRHGEAVELTEDGKLKKSPYTLDMIHSGALGLGRSSDGRLYQSTDHGASWVEVAAPPAGIEAADLGSCTSAGCDLGAFYRVGWLSAAPGESTAKRPAPAAPEVRRTRGLELSCRPQGGVVTKVQPRSADSPEDLGLGAARLPVANEKTEWTFVRSSILRSIASPVHDAPTLDDNTGQPLRALLTGFGTNHDGDVISVAGPNKNAMALRRGLSYAPPFDPTGRVVRTGIAMMDVVAAGRRIGMTTDEILSDDPTESGSVIALTSLGPTDPSDIVFHNPDRGLLAVVRGEHVRVAFRTGQSNPNVVSAVSLPGDETAFLEVDASGPGHVFKLGPSGITELFDVSSANESYYPANPDALAVGPKGELAILRTPSGSDPASALDPAFVVLPASPPAALAPWSEVKLADDPACKAERGGYRATLQTIAPWVRVATPELRVEDAPMLARVRWTPKHVCLEGFEVKLPPASVRTGSQQSGVDSVSFATWLVARGATFARVGTTDGIEWRQSLECSVVPPRP